MTNVLVYSTSTCPWCHKAMDFLKENKIKFTEVNVQEHPEKAEEVVQKSGQMGVPVIDVDGKIIVGFNERALRQALNIK
ncbi:MAG TPA: glutaredoxin family protein [archaeon]|nr:glutaredoxin family protein [archaeon]